MLCSGRVRRETGSLLVMTAFLTVISAAHADEDIIQAPSIHEQTLSVYVNAGETNWEMKLRASAYLDALLSELDSLSMEIGSEMMLLPDLMQEEFAASHEAFLIHADSWAKVQEDIQWLDLCTGEMHLGSGYGYTYSWHMCAMVWDRMQSYIGLLEEVRSPDFDGYVAYPGEGEGEIGGY